jgi:FixJ family two-component response regulator
MTKARDIVLVVDDDLAVRESLKFALELEGLSVRTCGSGYELLSHPELSQARCILLDYRMPAMDGFEVLDRLTARKVEAPVILITSQPDNRVAKRAQAAGIRHVLEKPFMDGTLLNSIQHVLGAPV